MPVRHLILAAAFALSSPLHAPLHAQTRSQLATANETAPGPRDAQITSIVPYAGTAADPLTLDVFQLHGPGPHPAVIIIHGGGFLHGTSRNGSEAYAADFLAPAGYAVFSINYRLGSKTPPGATFPEMLADVQRAIRFVRHNARQYGVDPNKIAILGGSAGGYLSNLAGVTKPSTLSTSADPIDRESDSIQAVVTLYGIADLATMPDPDFVNRLHLLGPDAASSAAIAAASPISLVHPDDPPFLLIHGAKDESVPIAQSTRFQAALQAAGDHAKLITIPGGMHGTGGWHSTADVPDWERETVQWLNTTLGHTGPVGEGIEPRATPTSTPAPAAPPAPAAEPAPAPAQPAGPAPTS